MDINQLRTDLSAEEQGVWVTYQGDVQFKLARIDNPRYTAKLAAAIKPHRKAIRTDTMPDKDLLEITTAVLAETVVLDWKGIEEDGKPVKYSVEKAKEFLLDPSLKDVTEWICTFAKDAANYRNDLIQQDIEVAKK